MRSKILDLKSVNTIKELFHDDIKFLILYGSSLTTKLPNDLDFVVVTKSNNEYINHEIGKMDFGVVGEDNFAKYLTVLDPVVATEPLITGKLIIGGNDEFNMLRKKLLRTKINNEILKYLSRRCLQEHLNAFEFYRQQDFLQSMKSLSFSIGYSLFARWYSHKNEKPILKQLLKETDLRMSKDLFKNLKNWKLEKKLTAKTALKFLQRWERIMVLGN